MNRSETAGLHGVLSTRNPDANVAVMPQQDGAKVVIRTSEPGSGMTDSHSGHKAVFVMADNGPVMKVLANGRLPRTADQVISEWSSKRGVS